MSFSFIDSEFLGVCRLKRPAAFVSERSSVYTYVIEQPIDAFYLMNDSVGSTSYYLKTCLSFLTMHERHFSLPCAVIMAL